jgi:hypothetical protein
MRIQPLGLREHIIFAHASYRSTDCPSEKRRVLYLPNVAEFKRQELQVTKSFCRLSYGDLANQCELNRYEVSQRTVPHDRTEGDNRMRLLTTPHSQNGRRYHAFREGTYTLVCSFAMSMKKVEGGN